MIPGEIISTDGEIELNAKQENDEIAYTLEN